jgi:hypothetical protein
MHSDVCLQASQLIQHFNKTKKNNTMKKYFLLIAILAVSIIAIFSCRKSSEPEVNPDQMTNSSNETEIKIQSFINRLNSDLKVEKTYSIDSAIWYSTASLNYTYAIYDSSLLHISLDTSTFSINLDRNNKVLESDLETAINQMTDSLEAFFDDLPNNTKHVIYCMVYELGTYSGRLDLGLVSAVAWGFSSTYYGSFGVSDYWFAIGDSGKCNGQYVGQDAADQLTFKIMHPLVANDPNWRIYTIPGSDVFFDDVDPEDYYYANAPRDYRGYIYYGNLPWPGPQCLDPDELNFYISSNGIPYIIDDMTPQGLDFVSIFVDGKLGWLDLDHYFEVHYLDLTYGVKYTTTVPASSL